jgi:hypothetical protein
MRTSPAAGRHFSSADRAQERELGQLQGHPGVITKLVTDYDGQ